MRQLRRRLPPLRPRKVPLRQGVEKSLVPHVVVARQAGAAVIIRGLRSGADFEYEYDMAFMNRRLERSVDMVSFMTSQDYMFVSSSLLKEVARLGGDVTGMVPPHVVVAVYAKFGLPIPEA